MESKDTTCVTLSIREETDKNDLHAQPLVFNRQRQTSRHCYSGLQTKTFGRERVNLGLRGRKGLWERRSSPHWLMGNVVPSSNMAAPRYGGVRRPVTALWGWVERLAREPGTEWREPGLSRGGGVWHLLLAGWKGCTSPLPLVGLFHSVSSLTWR